MMANSFTYACSDYPGMEDCPGKITASTKDEILRLVAVHAEVAHDENPSEWTEEDRTFLDGLIKEN
jgi:predicted small metal-binding protein